MVDAVRGDDRCQVRVRIGRHPDHERRSHPRLGLQRELAALRFHELAGDREAEAVRAVGVAGPIAPAVDLVPALPVALEHERLLGGLDTGTLVAHRDPDPSGAPATSDRDRRSGRREAYCVRKEVADRGPHGGPVDRHLQCGRGDDCDVKAARRRGCRVLVGKRVGFLREVCRGVDALQRQPAVRRQVVHGAAHAVDRAPRRGHLSRRLPLERGVARGELEVRRRDGKRRAQLVHDLLEQLALLFSTGVETVEHVVHAGSETSELVVARLELDTLPRLGAIDAVDDVGDLLDRSQHLSGDEPGERRRRHERDRDRREHPAQTVTPRPVCGRGRVLAR